MKRIDYLDKLLNHIYLFSENLTSIPETEISMDTGIAIDELTEYLEELGNRGFVNNYNNGSYITLNGRLAIEKSKKSQPFKDELNDNKIKKYWTITKIVAGFLNAIILIGIAIWAQTSSSRKTKLENDLKNISEITRVRSLDQIATIDSLNSIIAELKIKSIKPFFSNEIHQGTFKYELYFSEFGGRIANAECKVIINGNEIKIEQTDKTNLTLGKEIFIGFILKHKSGKWILSKDKNDVNTEEIGGCTDIPIIEFDKKLIEWC
ncbi:MAG: putative transcriptional regulator [Flavobacteriales bacterium]|jgi:predicted transcriptional regulator